MNEKVLLCSKRFVYLLMMTFSLNGIAASKYELINDSGCCPEKLRYLTYYAHTGLKPGLCYVYEYPVFTRALAIQTTDTAGMQMINRKSRVSFSLQTNAALYRHKKNHIGLHVNGMLVCRYTGILMFEAGAGIGLLHAFIPTTLYEYQDDGTFRERNMAGRTFITNVIMAGAGIRICKKKSRYFFGRPSLYLIYPYNNFLNIGYSFETGLLIKL